VPTLNTLYKYSGVAHFFKQTLLNNDGRSNTFIINAKELLHVHCPRYSVQPHCVILILECSL